MFRRLIIQPKPRSSIGMFNLLRRTSMRQRAAKGNSSGNGYRSYLRLGHLIPPAAMLERAERADGCVVEFARNCPQHAAKSDRPQFLRLTASQLVLPFHRSIAACCVQRRSLI